MDTLVCSVKFTLGELGAKGGRCFSSGGKMEGLVGSIGRLSLSKAVGPLLDASKESLLRKSGAGGGIPSSAGSCPWAGRDRDRINEKIGR